MAGQNASHIPSTCPFGHQRHRSTINHAAAQETAAETVETVVLDAITLTATSDTAVAADGYVATYNQAATKATRRWPKPSSRSRS